jgi:hypothetical protein
MSLPDAKEAYRVLIRACQRLESKCCDGKTFIPDDAFDETFTPELLQACARDLLGDIADIPDTLDRLYRLYRKTITILVLMTYESSFINFWKAGITDENLPLDEATLKSLDENLWWPTWDKHQYCFLALMFRNEEESQKWPDDFVLPIVEREEKGHGNFSVVYKIKIHPRYDQLNYQYEGGGQEVHPVSASQKEQLLTQPSNNTGMR